MTISRIFGNLANAVAVAFGVLWVAATVWGPESRGAQDHARQERFYAKCAEAGFSPKQCVFFHCGSGDECDVEGLK